MKHPKFKNESKTLKVLITCGGGIFGAITAYLLDSLNQTVYPDTGFDTSKFIDVYGGTSIGGVNALFLALHGDPHFLVEAYHDGAHKIFKQDILTPFKLVNGNKYPDSNIDPFLKKYLGGLSKYDPIKIFDLDEKVVVPTVDFKEEDPFIITNLKPEDTEKNLPVWLAGGATCAAPTYFDPRKWGRRILIDGGIIENVPVMCTVTSIISAWEDIDYGDIDMFVVGTGVKYPPADRTFEKVANFHIIDWLTEFLIPFVTTSNETCSQYWGKKLRLHYYDVFNPIPIEGSLDDYSLLYPSSTYPDGYLYTITRPYIKEFAERWQKFIEA